jgi:hypothetical protein
MPDELFAILAIHHELDKTDAAVFDCIARYSHSALGVVVAIQTMQYYSVDRPVQILF